MYAAHIIIIMNIILRGFTEHITDVMENFLQTAIAVIISWHSVAVAGSRAHFKDE